MCCNHINVCFDKEKAWNYGESALKSEFYPNLSFLLVIFPFIFVSSYILAGQTARFLLIKSFLYVVAKLYMKNTILIFKVGINFTFLYYFYMVREIFWVSVFIKVVIWCITKPWLSMLKIIRIFCWICRSRRVRMECFWISAMGF